MCAQYWYSENLTMTRLTRKTVEELTPEQRDVFDEIVANRPVRPQNGHIGGPFDMWMRTPEMGRLLVNLGGYFRFKSSVDRRYIELTILVTGAFWKAQFEWFAHEPMARKAGVPNDVIQAIQAGEVPDFSDEGDRLSWCIANELHQSHELSEETYAAAISKFGETGVTELIALSGFYTMVSMTLNGFDVALPEGAALPFDK